MGKVVNVPTLVKLLRLQCTYVLYVVKMKYIFSLKVIVKVTFPYKKADLST